MICHIAQPYHLHSKVMPYLKLNTWINTPKNLAANDWLYFTMYYFCEQSFSQYANLKMITLNPLSVCLTKSLHNVLGHNKYLI